MSQGHHCPECGAHVPLADANAKTVYCDHCGQPLLVLPTGMKAQGSKAALAKIPAIVSIGDSVAIGGVAYQVTGRVQYSFEDGFFDHFYLSGSPPCWLEQDEGEFRRYTEIVQVPEAPAWDDVGIGAAFPLQGGSFYPMEFGEGSVVGGAGVLPMVLLPGEAFFYIDGTWQGDAASLRYSVAGNFLLKGSTLSVGDIRVMEKTT